MPKEFPQSNWELAEEDCRQIVRLAIREDLDRSSDWTTISLVPHGALGQARILSRQRGILAGMRAVASAIQEAEADLQLECAAEDGAQLMPKQSVATLCGSVRDLLTLERILLNLLGRLSGIATLTRTYVDAIGGSHAGIYDTRKTTPGWRQMEKYAVHCGGGRNHRMGLSSAIMIKDNHLAFAAEKGLSPATAIEHVRQALRAVLPASEAEAMMMEIEVDNERQLRDVLRAYPDIVLLDNFSVEGLRTCVAIRDELAPQVELEASGGVTLETVSKIAQTGVERISVGALTHSAVNFDFGLDWS